jgi:hypothetical protein
MNIYTQRSRILVHLLSFPRTPSIRHHTSVYVSIRQHTCEEKGDREEWHTLDLEDVF